jgi:lambda repressor-like predicted transcriptional regulator
VKIENLLKDPNKAKKALKQAIENGDKKLAEALIPIVRDPWLTYEYVLKIAKGKIKDEWEDIIAQSSYASYQYAKKVLKGPFRKGEKAIAESPDYSYWYASDILQGLFPKGEDAIAESPKYAYLYAKNIIKGRWPKGEKAIAKDPEYAYRYALEVIKDRFPEAEEAIIGFKSHMDSNENINYTDWYLGFLQQINKLNEFLKDHPEIQKKYPVLPELYP